MRPVRVQLSRKKGWKMPANTVSVARPTKWGNPWTVAECGSAEEAVRMYRERTPLGRFYVPMSPESRMGRIVADIGELRGKNLACWCKPGSPCHADVLLALANEGEP